MSDESDVDDDFYDDNANGGTGDRRMHHNALERSRRDKIKSKFNELRDAIPTVKEEKVGLSRKYNAGTLPCSMPGTK